MSNFVDLTDARWSFADRDFKPDTYLMVHRGETLWVEGGLNCGGDEPLSDAQLTKFLLDNGFHPARKPLAVGDVTEDVQDNADLPVGSRVGDVAPYFYEKMDDGKWYYEGGAVEFGISDEALWTDREVLRIGLASVLLWVGDVLRSREQEDALPVGSMVSFNDGLEWTKMPDGLWTSKPQDYETGKGARDMTGRIVRRVGPAPEPKVGDTALSTPKRTLPDDAVLFRDYEMMGVTVDGKTKMYRLDGTYAFDTYCGFCEGANDGDRLATVKEARDFIAAYESAAD